jgi:hypothetical protein
LLKNQSPLLNSAHADSLLRLCRRGVGYVDLRLSGSSPETRDFAFGKAVADGVIGA